MKLALLGAVVWLVMPFAAGAQQAAPAAGATETNPVSNALRKIVERQAKNLVAAADEMPADKYAYRPTPAQMTFAKLVEHMAGSNNFLCSKISGAAAPADAKLSETDPKEKLVTALKASFDYCTQTLAKVDDSNLGEQLTLFGGRQASRAAAMIALANDFADHYSMAAIYLRLNGLLPPTAKPKE
ncbi:MAG: DinB family protein [Candidatus Acidiferrales bacterium]